MSPLRLLLVTRRFWPLVGGAESLIGYLATGLQQRGVAVTVLTGRWEKSWPKNCVFRDVSVVRLPMSRNKAWGNIRYLRSLSRWLRGHRTDFDLVVASGLGDDAAAAARTMAKSRVPVIVRAETAGECEIGQRHTRFARRIHRRCQAARAIAATSQQAVSDLLAVGYDSKQVHHVANGVPLPSPCDSQQRAVARSMLADAHPIFRVPPQAPLVVFAGRFDKAAGVRTLVESWRAIVQRWPNARLWLLGDGPLGPSLWERITDLGLTERIILPGFFDDLQQVLQAANLVVHPQAGGTTVFALQAMAAGVPVVASNTAEVRELIHHGQHGQLVSPGSVSALSTAIQRVLAGEVNAQGMAEAARLRVAKHFALDQMIDGYWELMERCVAARRETGTDQTTAVC